jgi:arginine/lysine/ornithine decarboxylase
VLCFAVASDTYFAGLCGGSVYRYILFGHTRDSGIRGADRRRLLRIDHAVAEHTKGRTVLNFFAPGETWAETGRWKREQRLIKIKRAADPLPTIRSNRPAAGLPPKGGG